MAATDTIRVGLIGFGAIGQRLAGIIEDKDIHQIEIVGALVRDASKSRGSRAFPFVSTVSELLALNPEVVVEAAGHDALREHGPAVLNAGCDLLFLGVGAFADPETERLIVSAASEGGSRARVASGAIGALDAISAAAVGGITRVTHTTRKPARTLLPAEEADNLREAAEIFRGSAREAALLFPESINVAAAVSLAGIGLDKTEVCVYADPDVTRNRHEVEVEGEFGWLKFEIQGIPTEENPRTGRLVAMSVIRQLLLRRAPLLLG
jgi:aspartate dehydrogenase